MYTKYISNFKGTQLDSKGREQRVTISLRERFSLTNATFILQGVLHNTENTLLESLLGPLYPDSRT